MGRRQPIIRTLTSLDLFSGAGGFSLGFEAAGFEAVGAIDIDEVSGKSYRANFGQRPIELFGSEGDLRIVRPARVKRSLSDAGVTELDVLVAAPPCQGFSRVGRGKLASLRSGQFLHDPRNELYLNAIRMLRCLRPRAFVFENVAGILHLGGTNFAEDVCREVRRAGYVVKAGLLNSAWYGVPQSRERLFVIGYRKDLGIMPSFPKREHHVRVTRGHLSQAKFAPDLWKDETFFVPFDQIPGARNLDTAVSVAEAFEDLPPFTQHLRAARAGDRFMPRRQDVPCVPYRTEPPNPYCKRMRKWKGLPVSRSVKDHYCRWTPRDFETFAKMKPGDRYSDAVRIAKVLFEKAKDVQSERGGRKPRRSDYIPPYPSDVFEEKWRKLVPGEPSHTVTAHLSKDTYSHIHFSAREKRAITLREAARIQSFPDSFEVAGNLGDAFQQIGNAVPPLLAHAVAKEVRRQLSRFDKMGV